MDILIGLCCLCCLCCCMVVLVGTLKRDAASPPAPERTELPEETEARRSAARAQAAYDQGFVNMMNYDGSPRSREEREQL